MLSAARAYKGIALLAVCFCVAGCNGGTGSPIPGRAARARLTEDLHGPVAEP